LQNSQGTGHKVGTGWGSGAWGRHRVGRCWARTEGPPVQLGIQTIRGVGKAKPLKEMGGELAGGRERPNWGTGKAGIQT